MNYDFTGKTVLVTGAANGIGRGIASTLAKANCKVYAVDRDAASLETLVREFPSVVPIVVDVTDWEKTKEVLEPVHGLDGLVNCAGVVHTSPAIDTDVADINRVLAANLLAPINMCQIVSKKMISEKKSGSIVNMSSTLGVRPLPASLAYCVSKAGLDMVTKQFALEMGPHSIRVNSIQPTMVKTEMLKKYIAAQPSTETNILERTPMPRTPEVEEVVGPVLYLLSDSAAMVTGSQLPVDAGILCNLSKKSFQRQ